MPYLQPLQQLRQQFEALSNDLEVCRNPQLRKALLKRMRVLFEEIDRLLSNEVLHLDSVRDRANES